MSLRFVLKELEIEIDDAGDGRGERQAAALRQALAAAAQTFLDELAEFDQIDREAAMKASAIGFHAMKELRPKEPNPKETEA